MFDKIKSLGTETAIYGVSTIAGRFLNFLLVPFYTNVLAPSEYGIATYVFSLVAFMNVVYGYGMESAYFRYSATKEMPARPLESSEAGGGSKEQSFSTPFTSLFITSSLFSFVLVLAASTLSDIVMLPADYTPIIHYASWILFLDTLAVIPFASLRMEHKARFFAFLKLLNILITVSANVILLVVYKMGVEGIFFSNLLASVITLMLLIPTIRRHFTSNFSMSLYRAMLKFGLPYIPAGLAAIVIQVVDRPILRMLTDDATVGVYQANYRLGIFMMLVVQMFDYAWKPFFLGNAQETNAKEMFARILTYFVLFMSLIFLLLTFFLPDIVHVSIFGRHLIHPDYWGALGIVPIVLLGYMFLGIFNNLVAGIYIEKKTHYLPLITFVGAVVNIGGNFFLIPRMDMYGAAWATFLSYFIMAVLLYRMVQRVYPVQYEWTRLGKIAVSCIAAYGLYFLVRVDEFALVWKAGLIVMFCLAMYLMKFLNKEELAFFKNLFSRPSTTMTPPPEPPAPL